MAKVAKRRGRYILDFYDDKGKRRWETLPKRTTLKKAKEKLRKIEDELNKGVWLPSLKIPTFEDVSKAWLKYKKPNLRLSTWSVYDGHTKNHFNDIKHLKINRVNLGKIERWITDRQEAGMNISTLRKVIVSFNQIMAYAVRHRYIDHNPFADAERPRGQGKDEGGAKINILKKKEIKAFLSAIKSLKYKTLFMLTIMSGARQGELLGLKWADLDLKNNQIKIRRTFNNQAWYKPKTRASKREIDLGPAMIRALKKWRLACPPNKFDLMFPNEAGHPLNHNNMVARHFNPALTKAKIDRIRFHDLRHTYASLLIDQGENIKYIQSQLGHSNPTVTFNVYAHLLNKTNPESALRLEESIFNTNGSKMVANTKKGVTANTVTP